MYLAVPEEAPASADPVAGWQHFLYPVRFSFKSAVAILLLILPRYPQLGWTLGFSVTLATAHPTWAIALAIARQSLLAWWLGHREIFNLHAMLLLPGCCTWI